MTNLFFIAVAGGMGTLGRYGLGGLAQRLLGIGFPYGTLLVNVLGSLLIGFIMQIGLNTDVIPRSMRVLLTVGFLGGFTTFSSFSWETVGYIQAGAWVLAGLNIAANLGLSLVATILGMALGRLVLGGI